MVTMAQSAVNRRNTHTHMDRTLSLTHFTSTVTTMWCKAPAQLLFFSACSIFSCFPNPPNSDMDYRIFNVRMWSLLCVCIHTGIGHTDSESARFWLGKTHIFDLEKHTFLTWKNTHFSCAPDRIQGFKPSSFGSRVWRSTDWATPN